MEQTEFTEKQPPPHLVSNEEPLYCDIEEGPHYSKLDTSKMIRRQLYDNKNVVLEDVKQNGKTIRDSTFWHPPPNNNDACGMQVPVGDYTDYELMSSRLNPRPAKQLHYMTVQPNE